MHASACVISPEIFHAHITHTRTDHFFLCVIVVSFIYFITAEGNSISYNLEKVWVLEMNQTTVQIGFLGALAGKQSACNAGDQGSIPGWEDPWKRKATHSSISPWESPWLYSPWVVQSWTQITWFSLHNSNYTLPCIGLMMKTSPSFLRAIKMGVPEFAGSGWDSVFCKAGGPGVWSWSSGIRSCILHQKTLYGTQLKIHVAK